MSYLPKYKGLIIPQSPTFINHRTINNNCLDIEESNVAVLMALFYPVMLPLVLSKLVWLLIIVVQISKKTLPDIVKHLMLHINQSEGTSELHWV